MIRTKTITPEITGRKQQLSNRSDYKNNGIRIDLNGDYNSRIAEKQIQIHGYTASADHLHLDMLVIMFTQA